MFTIVLHTPTSYMELKFGDQVLRQLDKILI